MVKHINGFDIKYLLPPEMKILSATMVGDRMKQGLFRRAE